MLVSSLTDRDFGIGVRGDRARDRPFTGAALAWPTWFGPFRTSKCFGLRRLSICLALGGLNVPKAHRFYPVAVRRFLPLSTCEPVDRIWVSEVAMRRRQSVQMRPKYYAKLPKIAFARDFLAIAYPHFHAGSHSSIAPGAGPHHRARKVRTRLV